MPRLYYKCFWLFAVHLLCIAIPWSNSWNYMLWWLTSHLPDPLSSLSEVKCLYVCPPKPLRFLPAGRKAHQGAMQKKDRDAPRADSLNNVLTSSQNNLWIISTTPRDAVNFATSMFNTKEAAIHPFILQLVWFMLYSCKDFWTGKSQVFVQQHS